MKGRGTGVILHFADDSLALRIDKHEKEKFHDLVKREVLTAEEHRKRLDVSIDFEAVIESSESNATVFLKVPANPIITFADITEVKSRAQENTFWGILRFIFWATEGRKPVDNETYWLYEGMLQKYGKEATNPVTNRLEPIRISDPRMDKRTLSVMIEGALNELAQTPIPKEILDDLGGKMKRLWTTWYRWRYEQGDADPLFSDDIENRTWDEYRTRYPVCELCSLAATDTDQLERAHIITVGSDKTLYDEPWNWLHVHHSHHVTQHADRQQKRTGWDVIERQFPHIKAKIKRAHDLANEKQQTELEIF